MSHASANPIPFSRSSAVARPLGRRLPLPASPLLGREDEIARVMSMVDRGDRRLVTLLGPGGVGKTRLALEIARRIGTQFAEGATFVPLESIRDAAKVPDAVALALGIPTQPGRDTAELLVEVLAERHLLVVLDNCEQVVGAAPLLAWLISCCPRLRVLTTSRRPLQVAAEQRVRLAPLPVPEPGGARTAAVDLFVERGLAANVDLVLDGPALETIADICRRLDGLPLAIELAAARVTTLSPQALLARLTNRLALLSGRRNDAPDRMQSMRATIGWSYDLLTPDEQRLFRQASMFVGGFSLAAAQVLARSPQAHGPDTVIDLVQSLVDHNLVLTVPDTSEARFRMLETIREYGQEEASRHGEIDDAAGVRAEYFLSLAPCAERNMTGPDQGVWLERLEADYLNFLSTIVWLKDQRRVEDAIAIICSIQWYLSIRGHMGDVSELLECWHGREDLSEPSRARLLHALGGFKQATGSLRESVVMLEGAADAYRKLGDSLHEATARAMLVTTLDMSSDVDVLEGAARKALAVARIAADHRSVSSNLHYLAKCCDYRGDLSGARKLQDESNQVAIDAGDTWARAFVVRMGAWEAASEGRFDDAEAFALEARDMFELLGSQRELLGDWAQLAKISLARGDFEQAASRIDIGLRLARDCGYTWYASALLVASGLIDSARGAVAAASTTLVTALRSLEEPMSQRLDTAACLDAFALLAARSRDIAQATRFHAASRRLRRDAGIDLSVPPTDVVEVWLERALRDTLGIRQVKQALLDSETIAIDIVVAEAMTYHVADSQAVIERPFGLSRRELEVLRLMASGNTNQQIADELCLALRTITSHVTRILAKLDVQSRTGAVSLAIRERIA